MLSHTKGKRDLVFMRLGFLKGEEDMLPHIYSGLGIKSFVVFLQKDLKCSLNCSFSRIVRHGGLMFQRRGWYYIEPSTNHSMPFCTFAFIQIVPFFEFYKKFHLFIFFFVCISLPCDGIESLWKFSITILPHWLAGGCRLELSSSSSPSSPSSQSSP